MQLLCKNVAEVELASTPATLPGMIAKVDTRCNSMIACNIARNVASCVQSCVRSLTVLRELGSEKMIESLGSLRCTKNPTVLLKDFLQCPHNSVFGLVIIRETHTFLALTFFCSKILRIGRNATYFLARFLYYQNVRI